MKVERWVQVNRLPLMFLLLSTGLLVLVLRLGANAERETWIRDVALVLCGTVVGAAASVVQGLVTATEAYRQTSYAVRAESVRRLLRRARALKDRCLFWLVEVEFDIARSKAGNVPRRLVRTPIHVRRSSWELQRAAFDEFVFVGPTGDQAVRAFRAGIEGLQMESFASQLELEVELARLFGVLSTTLFDDLGFLPGTEPTIDPEPRH